VLLLDMNMPVMNGCVVLAKLMVVDGPKHLGRDNVDDFRGTRGYPQNVSAELQLRYHQTG
jgi:hypothetical protein